MLNSPDTGVVETPDDAGERRQFLRFFVLIFLLMLPLLLSITQINANNLDVRLASGFLHGHLYADYIEPNYVDIVPFNGYYYIPFGPLTSVMEMPFVALFSIDFNNMWLQFALTMVNVWLLWKLLTLLQVGGSARFWLAALFFIGAQYLASSTETGSWFLSSITAVTLTLGALVLAEQRQWLWVGLMLGGGLATRFSLTINVLYFVLLLLMVTPAGRRIRALSLLGVGLAGPIALLLWYNYARFGNPLETGYAYSLVASTLAAQLRKEGVFSLSHVPTNFYYMFLKSVDGYPGNDVATLQFPWVRPSPRGMGLFFTTPALLYIFRAPLRDRRVLAALPTVLIAIFGLLAYYYTGAFDGLPQYGYRYLLDITPLLFVILVAALRRVQGCTPVQPLTELPALFKWLTIASIVLGLWGVLWVSDSYHGLGTLLLQQFGLAH